VADADGYTIAHEEGLERNGRWGLVRRSIGLGSFGMNLVEIEPGGQIPEHTEAERDHEEVFVLLSGRAVAVWVLGVGRRATLQTATLAP